MTDLIHKDILARYDDAFDRTCRDWFDAATKLDAIVGFREEGHRLVQALAEVPGIAIESIREGRDKGRRNTHLRIDLDRGFGSIFQTRNVWEVLVHNGTRLVCVDDDRVGVDTIDDALAQVALIPTRHAEEKAKAEGRRRAHEERRDREAADKRTSEQKAIDAHQAKIATFRNLPPERLAEFRAILEYVALFETADDDGHAAFGFPIATMLLMNLERTEGREPPHHGTRTGHVMHMPFGFMKMGGRR